MNNLFAVRAAVRNLRRHPSEYLSATAILALGMGMSVALFSLLDAVLLRPLPFPRQDAVVVIWKANPLAGAQVQELAYPELGDLQNIPDLESVAVLPTSLYGYERVLQRAGAEPVEIESTPVSHDFFRVLGIAPAIGRDFVDSDERVGVAPVVIVSHRVWRDYLGGNRRILGQMIRLNGRGHTVIGVMEPGVEFPRGAGMWVPPGVEPRVVERRDATFLQAIARIKPGHPRDQVTPQVNALFGRLAAEHPDVYPPTQRAVVTPLVEYWTGSARLHLIIMFAAAVLLLLAATISAGNLLLSRTLRRRPEFATRLALGASRGQILRQIAGESVIMAMLAAGGGLALANGVIRFLVRLAPADIPRISEAGLDFHGFAAAAGAAVLAALACSLIPGWSATSMELEWTLREEGRGSSPSRRSGTIRRAFILAQAAVTVMLLSLAALLVVSYRAMISADTGFANRDALSMNVALRGPGLLAAQGIELKSRRAFYKSLLDRLRASPGVTSAATVLVRPLEGPIGWDVSYEFEFEAGQKDRRALPEANYEVVTPGYFQTVGTPLLEGRDFSEHDSEGNEPVAIISRALAQRIRRAGHAPVGSRLRIGSGAWIRVAGVCGDARYRNITQTGADVFVPYLQAPAATNYLVIRGTRSTQELSLLVRRTLAAMDPSQAVSGEALIGELIERSAPGIAST
jgi:predicted permease